MTKTKKTKKVSSSLINMGLALLITCTLSALSLGWVEELTADSIKKNSYLKELAAISSVVNEFNNNPYEEKMTITTPNKRHKLDLFPIRKDGVINSFAIKTYSNNGFGGRIEMIVGFYIDGAIKSFAITQHKETPGLGSKINDDKFKQQFNGYNPQKGIFKVRQDGGDIDAVTGATISSRAVIKAIQRAVDAFNNFYQTGVKDETTES